MTKHGNVSTVCQKVPLGRGLMDMDSRTKNVSALAKGQLAVAEPLNEGADQYRCVGAGARQTAVAEPHLDGHEDFAPEAFA